MPSRAQTSAVSGAAAFADPEPAAAAPPAPKPKSAYATPATSPAGTPWKVHAPEAEKQNPATTRSTMISDLPGLVARLSKMGFNWSDEAITWAVFKVAVSKNLGPGGAIMDSEVADLLHAHPYKGRKKLARDVETSSGPSNKECTICLDEDREVVLVPCGHTFCYDCGEGLRSIGQCPTCRTSIETVIRFFA